LKLPFENLAVEAGRRRVQQDQIRLKRARSLQCQSVIVFFLHQIFASFF